MLTCKSTTATKVKIAAQMFLVTGSHRTNIEHVVGKISPKIRQPSCRDTFRIENRVFGVGQTLR
uniref:Uncharacterized protein n=1 Tax=Romanomermis culicivorax TaxID=13658 RepID=A0A915IFJ4_ROMCU